MAGNGPEECCHCCQYPIPSANCQLETGNIGTGNILTLATFTAVRRNLHSRQLGLRPAARLDAGNRHRCTSFVAQLDPSNGIRADCHLAKGNAHRRHNQSRRGNGRPCRKQYGQQTTYVSNNSYAEPYNPTGTVSARS